MLSDATRNKIKKEKECNTLSEIPAQSSLQFESDLNFKGTLVQI